MLRQPEHTLTRLEKALRRVLLILARREAGMRANQLFGKERTGRPTFVIKPAGDGCNYRCVYCFHHGDLEGIVRMDLPGVKRIYQAIQSVHGSAFQIVWHGGEPLLAGKPFFAGALALQEEMFGKVIDNRVQTNGSLIDAEWAAFFKRHNLSVGISLDGDRETNDRTRRDSRGKSCYEASLRAIRIVRESGMPVGVISVIARGRKNGRHHYRILRDAGVSVCNINPATQPVNLRPDPEEHALFVKEFIQAWIEAGGSDPRPSIFELLFPLLVGNPASIGCIWNGACYGILEVQPDGRVKGACDRNVDFSAFPQALLGNLVTGSPEEVLAGQRIRQFIALTTQRPQSCQDCQLAWSCRGGCIEHRMNIAGSLQQPDPYCAYYKQVADFMQELIDQVRSFPAASAC